MKSVFKLIGKLLGAFLNELRKSSGLTVETGNNLFGGPSYKREIKP